MHCTELHVKASLFLLDICFCLHICLNVTKDMKWNGTAASHACHGIIHTLGQPNEEWLLLEGCMYVTHALGVLIQEQEESKPAILS